MNLHKFTCSLQRCFNVRLQKKITCNTFLYACVCAYYHARFKLSLIKYIIGTTFVIVACPTCYCMKSDIESLFVQRTNKISIHCSFSFPMKGLFEERLSNHIDGKMTYRLLLYYHPDVLLVAAVLP